MSGKGISIKSIEKEIVVQVKHYFDKEKKSSNKEIYSDQSAVKLASCATGLSEISVKRIMAEFNKGTDFAPPALKGSSPYAIDESVKTLCQDIIRTYNIHRQHISLRLLVGILNDEHGIKVARETLRVSLFRWSILYGPVLRHTALRERDYVVCARRDYLLQKRQLDNSNRTLVYLDETFINKNYSGSDLSWYCDDWDAEQDIDKSYGPYINKPSGKGERLIILNAVTNKGWVDGAQLVFKAKSNSGDYHGSMDEHNFTKWFTGQLLPNIPDNAVIIMDNASYHNTYKEDGVPPLTSKKIVLQKWLSENNVAYEDTFIRPQLIELIKNNRPPRLYKLDDMLRNDPNYKFRGIEILRTPQYHPELQPIEKCWAVVKQYMAQHCDFTLKGLHKNLEKAWSKVTAVTMMGVMEKITYWQDHHYEQDDLLDAIDDEDAS
jgi:hypothetical protein